jgi:hypothetical protein
MILTRNQYDQMLENKDAVTAYQKCEHVTWFLGGVRIRGTDDQEKIIWAAIQKSHCKCYDNGNSPALLTDRRFSNTCAVCKKDFAQS